MTDIISEIVPAPLCLQHKVFESDSLVRLTQHISWYIQLPRMPVYRTHMLLSNCFQEYDEFSAPHRLKAVSADKPVIMLPLILYSDDTSGNRSKRWNKFDSWCFKLAGLPNSENQKLHNIATSS